MKHRRLALAAFCACTARMSSGCHTPHDIATHQVTADSLTGREFSFPTSTVYRNTATARPMPRRVCRVVVLTYAGCGVASVLAQGWRQELLQTAQQVGVAPETMWLVIGSDSAAADLFRDTPEGVGPTWLVRDSSSVLARFDAAQGSPHTLVVDVNNIVQGVVDGGILPTRAELREACRPRPATRATGPASHPVARRITDTAERHP